ncbi:response regulator [Oceanobacillus jeddahense]|uniref:response regulator n=1 Tax=Oceanobacillus jeddahense TaxID=1462527 RepID=UPI00069469DC|nr:response regulator [Oceanobacillus jeddahense]
MNICIIDDEQLALEYLDFLLNKIEGVQITGKFNNAKQLINHVQTEDVDAVLMDIHMPDIHGIDLAEQLLNIKPVLNIAFVTAYNEYAVRAFELNALDYILKPVQLARLELTIERIKKVDEKLHKAPLKAAYHIKNLGAVRFYKEESPLEVKWRTSKAKELFFYFLQNHRNIIRKEDLIDFMWAHLSWEKANSQLYSTVYQIRKVIQQMGIPMKIVSREETYEITLGEEVDIQSIGWKQEAWKTLEENHVSESACIKLLEAYQGDYLQGIEADWILEERKEIREIWLQIIDNMINDTFQNKPPSSRNISQLSALVSFDKEARLLLSEKMKS